MYTVCACLIFFNAVSTSVFTCFWFHLYAVVYIFHFALSPPRGGGQKYEVSLGLGEKNEEKRKKGEGKGKREGKREEGREKGRGKGKGKREREGEREGKVK